MHSHTDSQSSGSSADHSTEDRNPYAQSEQLNCSSKNVMCLVYPDGRLATVELELDSHLEDDALDISYCSDILG